jgi:hypothetical protein
MHCREHDPQRPPDATRRVIYSLYVDLEPEPSDTTGGKALIIPIDRGGIALVPGDRQRSTATAEASYV